VAEEAKERLNRELQIKTAQEAKEKWKTKSER